MAVDSFAMHKKELAQLQTGIQKVYEYEKHRPKNEITTKLWEILTDTSGNLYGGFLVKWKKEVVLKKVYVENKKEQIAKAFDQIIELESKKIKTNK